MTIITDCDGIFTSANIPVSKNNIKPFKLFSVNDSLTIRFIKDKYPEIDILVLSGDSNIESGLTKDRMDYYGLKTLYCPNIEKYSFIKNNFDLQEVIFIGDDIFDILTLKEVFYSATVNNAPKIIKSSAKYISEYNGGESAFTDIIFHLFKNVLNKNIEEDLKNYIKNYIKK